MDNNLKRDCSLLSYDPRTVIKTLFMYFSVNELEIFLALGRVGSGRKGIICEDVERAKADLRLHCISCLTRTRSIGQEREARETRLE